MFEAALANLLKEESNNYHIDSEDFDEVKKMNHEQVAGVREGI